MSQLLDSHIHLGRSLRAEPVKIGAGSNLTVDRIPQALRRYGAGHGCVVDLGTTRGLRDLEQQLATGDLSEGEDGAFLAPDGTRIIGGLEAEFRLPPLGPFHLLAYAPGLDALRELCRVYAEGARNPALSTQRMHTSPEEFRRAVDGLGGVLVVAHAFTPHRGLLGVGLLPDAVFRDTRDLGLELGLSADVAIAQGVGAIGGMGLVGGSDAHGPDTIGREVNEINSGKSGFPLLRELVRRGADRIYGMNPAFGKYHRTYCPRCASLVPGDPPQMACPTDPRHRVVVGVLDRATALGPPTGTRAYPDYRYQLPLGLLPGFGPSARDLLVARFGSLHGAMHEAPLDEVAALLGAAKARTLRAMRDGALPASPGGGGHWGRALPAGAFRMLGAE